MPIENIAPGQLSGGRHTTTNKQIAISITGQNPGNESAKVEVYVFVDPGTGDPNTFAFQARRSSEIHYAATAHILVATGGNATNRNCFRVKNLSNSVTIHVQY
ncbi:hypothetical protein [Niabella aurantiaca]|uniref:hypothetical protein n=1 Tax=Niabella aurantiaca TaxID=379900 RepID=UPI000360A33A|nr:hypothetical protein [Niabella aurantiaca]